MRIRVARLAIVLVALSSCSRFGAVYPPRPAPSETAAVADPEPSRVVVHVAITADGLRAAIDGAAPKTGDGSFPLLGSDRAYHWARDGFDVSFSQGKIVLQTKVHATVSLPLKQVEIPIDLRIEAEPIVSSEYAVKLQSVSVHATSTDTSLSIADRLAGIYQKIEAPVKEKLDGFAYDLRPLLSDAYARVAKPIDFPVGDAHGCARLRVLEVEAAPTVLAGGVEKDLALVVAPSITLPCDTTDTDSPRLPPLSNVASITPGPFTVTVPIAAKYDELTRAMTMAFTDGKLFFSKDYPEAYLSNPEIYESQGSLVLKLHIGGPVHAAGIDTILDGDLFLSGHPAVVDNELSIPDLEPTIETHSFLLSLKAIKDEGVIRDQARQALRLDIGARIREAKEKLGSELTFGNDVGCFTGDVDRVEVKGVYPHAGYLRIYVAVTARARAMIPCPSSGVVRPTEPG
jgi:hypothetical protein